MRSWVVWCLRANLDDDGDDDALCGQSTPHNRRSFLSRQAALDTSTSSRDRLRLHRAVNSHSLGSDGAGKGSAQNSFDSVNCNET